MMIHRVLSYWICYLVLFYLIAVSGFSKEIDIRKNPESVFCDGNIVNVCRLLNDGKTDQALKRCKEIPELLNNTGRSGLTAIWWAVFNENLQAFSEMIKLGAKLDLVVELETENRKTNLLERILNHKNPDFLKSTVALGVDLSKIGPRGQTLLILATRSGNKVAINILVEGGVNINGKDKWGRFPLQTALARNDFELALYIAKLGADWRTRDDDDMDVIGWMLQARTNLSQEGRAQWQKIYDFYREKDSEFPRVIPIELRDSSTEMIRNIDQLKKYMGTS